MSRVLALVDGEHYPAVTKSALEELGKEHDVVCAVFLGGTEKIGSDKDLAVLGVPVIRHSDHLEAISQAIDEYRPQEVIDLSDEPILGYRERFAIASLVLARGVVYSGADFEFRPPKQSQGTKKASMSVVGTGKRIGKTAIGGYVARVLAKEFIPIVVTMGRGGPAEPEVIPGTELDISPEYLLSVSRCGKHASSDHYEDALTSRVTTIGSRRCGGGMSGQTYFSNVDRAAQVADETEGNIIVFEGSGCTIPSVRTDVQILVIGAHQPLDYIASYLGPYRVRTSDIVILTMCESPMAEESQVQAMYDAVRSLNPNAFIARTIFRPRPLGDITRKRVAVCLTASKKMGSTIGHYLEEKYGCEVVGVTCSLSNRPVLREDLARFDTMSPDIIVTELKAAAVDVVTAWGVDKGYKVVYLDNEPYPVGPSDHVDQVILELARKHVRSRRV